MPNRFQTPEPTNKKQPSFYMRSQSPSLVGEKFINKKRGTSTAGMVESAIQGIGYSPKVPPPIMKKNPHKNN
jgi:hypothetical protein